MHYQIDYSYEETYTERYNEPESAVRTGGHYLWYSWIGSLVGRSSGLGMGGFVYRHSRSGGFLRRIVGTRSGSLFPDGTRIGFSV